jgi:transcriptional regulator with XRE-family HTH domain
MKNQNISKNLRLLIGYSTSITDVCKDIKISRQQFTKYLSGRSLPRLRSLQMICDYFGLEDWELLLPHDEFRQLITIRSIKTFQNNQSFSNRFISEIQKKSRAIHDMGSFLGYYYNHFIIKAKKSMIQRSLIQLFEVDGFIGTRSIERLVNIDGSSSVTKYDGVAYYSGHRLYISERERFLGQTIWHTTLFATSTRQPFFSGLGLGNTTESVQDISCYRSIFQFLGSSVNRHNALRGCGMFDPTSPEIPIFIRQNIHNTIDADENAFVAA